MDNPTPNDVREAIYQHFAALWRVDDETTHTPYWFDDEKAEPVGGPWVRLTVRHNAPARQSVSERGVQVRQTGTIYMQYFHPPGTGSDVADAHGQRFIAGFGFQKLADSSIRTTEAQWRELGLVEQGRWWSANGRTDFFYDTVQ